MLGQFETIAEAFSRTAEKYDALAEDHPNQTRDSHPYRNDSTFLS